MNTNQAQKTIMILTIITTIIMMAFLVGRHVQFQTDKQVVQDMLDWAVQCNLPLNDEQGTVIETDCLTPQSYAVTRNGGLIK